MKGLTIVGFIGFLIVISVFLIHSYAEGIVQDSMISATGEVINNSPVDDTAKEGISHLLALFGFVGAVAFITGLLAIFKKFF